MKKITINALVDIGALIAFIPSLISGIVLYHYLPSGSGRGNAGVYLGILRPQWVNMHDVASFALAALLIIHLLLHWKFFRNIRKCIVTNDKAACSVGDQ